MRVFGCLSFACNPTQSKDKFAAKGVPCVFIGYPSSTKGFRLLNLVTMQPFVTRHVMFSEKVFPLNTNSEHSYMTPMPTAMSQSQTPHFDDEICLVDQTETVNQHTNNNSAWDHM